MQLLLPGYYFILKGALYESILAVKRERENLLNKKRITIIVSKGKPFINIMDLTVKVLMKMRKSSVCSLCSVYKAFSPATWQPETSVLLLLISKAKY